MTLRVAIQMDPPDRINIDTDSTFALALEAQKRGHTLFYYPPEHLSLKDGLLSARVQKMTLRREKGNHLTLEDEESLNLADDIDIILMRQDPPFDMAYITATYLLENLKGKTLVLNDPEEVRNAPEKLFVTNFGEFMPPTLISSDKNTILDFRKEHRDIILKPLYGNGGAQVFHVDEHSDNLSALLEMFTHFYREPIVVQKYLPAVREGDKRIILIDGQPAGAVMRVPAAGEARANLHVGGVAEKTELTSKEKAICAALGPALKERGLVFTGVDTIGDQLTEINVTSPTGLQEINRLNDDCLEAKLWDSFEKRFNDMTSSRNGH